MTHRWLARLTVIAACALPMVAAAASDVAAQENEAFPAAPTFNVKTWIQGKSTSLEDKDTIYVVELWATWCGPCIQAMPHLAELQKKEAGAGVRVVALTEEDASTVKSFVKRHTEMAPLTVAVDREVYGKFGVSAIPTSFIVKNKAILWSGHPSEMPIILERVKAGRWDPGSLTRSREFKQRAEAFKSHWTRGGAMTPSIQAEGNAMTIVGVDEPEAMNSVAWALLTEVPADRRPVQLALQIAEVANRGSKGESDHILDTYARALYLTGDSAQAISVQSKAVKLCRAHKGRCGELEEVLAIYEAGKKLTP